MEVEKTARWHAMPILLSLLRDFDRAWDSSSDKVRHIDMTWCKNHVEHENLVPALRKLHSNAHYVLMHSYSVERQLYIDHLLQHGYEVEWMDVEGVQWIFGFRLHGQADRYNILIA